MKPTITAIKQTNKTQLFELVTDSWPFVSIKASQPLVKSKHQHESVKSELIKIKFPIVCSRLPVNDKQQVTEVARIAWFELDKLPKVRSFVRDLVVNAVIAGKIDPIKRHFIKNSNRYEGTISQSTQYIELLPEEAEIMTTSDSFQKYIQQQIVIDTIQIVELGFNYVGQICKVAVEIDMIVTDRIMFLCLGTADFGVKTYNIHPIRKRKTNYYSHIGIPYLSLEHAIKLYALQ